MSTQQVTIGRGTALLAYAAGAIAAEKGLTMSELPYDPASSSADVRVCAAAWTRGYVRADGVRSGTPGEN